MTKNEASSRLFDIKQFIENNGYFGEEDLEAIDMAWDALYDDVKDDVGKNFGELCYKTLSGEYSIDEATSKFQKMLEGIVVTDIKKAINNQ